MQRLAVAVAAWLAAGVASAEEVTWFAVPPGAGPHDVAPAPDGTVWYTAQQQGALGRLDPATGRVDQIPLGRGSAPHGVIVGPDGAAWVTDSGLDAVVRVDGATRATRAFPLPEGRRTVNLNTATFDRRGRLWFTGQSGVYGRLDPATGEIQVWNAPRGAGPYGITTTPDGAIFYASLAGNHVARIDVATGKATVVEPPTRGQGARRVWSDSKGRVWVSEWKSGQVSVHDPSSGAWRSWKLPGENPRAYAVYVDENDHVWLSDFGANAIVRFDPASGRFASFPSDRPSANVRQLLGREGEVWGAESGTDRLVRIRHGR
jgi:virginiamycin B lyase